MEEEWKPSPAEARQARIECCEPEPLYDGAPFPRELLDRIRREFLGGMSMAAICRGLNADGIPSERGGRWNPRNLDQALWWAGLGRVPHVNAAQFYSAPMIRLA